MLNEHAEAGSADVAGAVTPLLRQRWSPRSFDPGVELSERQLQALLEAARWAPSSRNRQPWRFLVGRRGDETFKAVYETLAPRNQQWAGDAAALIVAVAETSDADGRPLPGVEYDLGLAVAQLVVQAHAEGLHVHQMGGFSPAGVRAAFGVPPTFTPVVVVAVGRVSQATDDTARPARTRRPLSESAYAGSWGRSWDTQAD
ncbi:MAG: nitroreductase family protein [Actinomycetota bacterium]|nr:nitroreductase family protein [Actinomycetota bacterium]